MSWKVARLDKWAISRCPIGRDWWILCNVTIHQRRWKTVASASLSLAACYSPPPALSFWSIFLGPGGSEVTLEHVLLSSLESAPVTTVKSQASEASELFKYTVRGPARRYTMSTAVWRSIILTNGCLYCHVKCVCRLRHLSGCSAWWNHTELNMFSAMNASLSSAVKAG